MILLRIITFLSWHGSPAVLPRREADMSAEHVRKVRGRAESHLERNLLNTQLGSPEEVTGGLYATVEDPSVRRDSQRLGEKMAEPGSRNAHVCRNFPQGGPLSIR